MLTEEIKKILLTSQPCKYLSSQELDTLLSYCTLITFAAGAIVFKQGQKSDGMYIIIHGQAVVTIKTLGEEVLNLATLNQGNFVGEMSLMEIGPTAATVFASSELQCLFIPTTYFEMLSPSYPEIKYKITKAITEEVCHRINQLCLAISSTISASNMETGSLFNDIIKSFTKPVPTSFDAAQINVDTLHKSDIFRHFTPEEFNETLQYAELIKAPENCTLISQDTTASSCYIILRGAVQLSIKAKHKIAKLSVLGPADVFCNMTLINQRPSPVSYTTCERANLLKISEKNLEIIKEKNIHLWKKIFNLLCGAIVNVEKSANKLQIRLDSELYNQ
jgi:CRP/FNR family cyclic AMP-dependent transcriptional regulator